MTELSTRFDFREVETRWCRHWEEQGTFHAVADPGKKSYSVVIPPPNVTGILHMGHALNNTLQDIIVRYKRMRGFSVCWMPGTDHAGIATQNVVERQLGQEGKTRYDIGREEMLTRLWAWKEQYGGTIINQLKKLGSSCDWSRTRFTMDAGYSEAVNEVFVRLYEKGLIYQGRYIINWCPRCQTALSDEEAEYREQQGALYHIRYPFKDRPGEFLVVATTRPETMLGDTAVAVNPADERYRAMIGRTLVLPIVNREIPVIADEFVDPAFGTGAVKVTPAHDPNDFAMGTRHQLEFLNILHPDGRLNDQAGEFAGMDRFEAREAIIETLQGLKRLDKVEAHTHAVGHCYRCHTVVEPYLSKQWFVRMKPLAEPALRAVTEGRIKFTPDRWTKVYLNWMDNIRDWCISRQIWWGHRIPVWYCQGISDQAPACPQPIVSQGVPTRCPHCGSERLVQDEDVLDTWFSSWLWPFATFGWPRIAVEEAGQTGHPNEDLAYFYPTQSLFTASEIIFFWVARMIMAGLEFMGEVPFSDVYIHGTVRDAQGRKMSKSLGNALDPLEIIEEYGADALRFSLIMNSGQDLYISKEKFEGGRNFANKIWNASRLVLSQVPAEHRCPDIDQAVADLELDLPTRWILSRFFVTLEGVERALDGFRFSEAENLIFDFFWRTYCDWYLELIKNRFDEPAVARVAFSLLEQSVRMMQPFLPFVTAEVWQHLGLDGACAAEQPWPELKRVLIDEDAEQQMVTLMELVTALRNTRAQWGIKPQQRVDCLLSAADEPVRRFLAVNQDSLAALVRFQSLQITDRLPRMKDCATGVVATIKFAIPLDGIVDVAEESRRMRAQIMEQNKAMSAIEKRLGNSGFTDKAPAEVVAKERERLTALRLKNEEMERVLTALADTADQG